MKKISHKVLLTFLFISSIVYGDTVVKPESVTSTIAGDAGSSVNYLINDNAGNSGDSLHTTTGEALALNTGEIFVLSNAVAYHAGNGQYESWTAKKTAGKPVFVFDLGANKTIHSAVLWQYGNWAGNTSAAGENDTQNFRMLFHTAAEGNSFDFGTETADLTATASRIQNLQVNGNVAQQFNFTETTARYIAMTIDSNFGGSRYGLGEVRFTTSGSTPPPDPNIDTDGDGLPDMVESNTGIYISPSDTGSDPNNPNTDGDRFKDGAEVRYGTDPNDSTDSPNLPNVLFIMADDLGVGELGCYGQTKIVTPRIDQLASQGICLDDFYAPCPVCGPTRAMLLTGLNAGCASIRNNRNNGHYQTPLPSNSFTLGHLMQNAGYATSCIGKWGLGSPTNSGAPNNQGFDHFFGYLDQVKAHYYYPQYLWRNRNKVYYSTNLAASVGATVDIPGAHNEKPYNKSNDGNVHSQDAMTKETLEWITAHKDEAFFMYLCFPIPHTSIQPPGHIDDLTDADGIVIDNTIRTCVDEFYPVDPSTGERPFGPPIYHAGTWSYTATPDKRHEYAAMISAMDRDVGRIWDHLQSLGIAENTLVFFTSDNGTTWITEVDSTYFHSVGDYRGLKEEVYDGGIRVPFVAWWPNHIPARTSHVKLLGSLDDIMATLAELTRTPCPANTTGRSILPTLLGHPEAQKIKPYVYHEFKDKNALPGHDHTLYWTRSIRKANWKLHRYTVVSSGALKYELFNLETDPTESTNVYTSNPAIVAQLDRMMDAAHQPSKFFFRNKDEAPHATPEIKNNIKYGTSGSRLKGTGYTLDGLFEEVTSKVTFKTTINTSGGSTHNGSFLFGDGTNVANFISVKVDDDANTLTISYGAATSSVALDGNRPFKLEITWDPATASVEVKQKSATTSLTLTTPPTKIDHIAYAVDNAQTDFSQTEVQLDTSTLSNHITSSYKGGTLTFTYKRPKNDTATYSYEESTNICNPSNWVPSVTMYEQAFDQFGGIQNVYLTPLIKNTTNTASACFYRVLKTTP